MTFEDPAGLLLGVMPVGTRVGVDPLGAGLAAQLGDRHPVKDRVHAPVAAGVIAVAHWFAGPLAGRGNQRCAGVEPREPAFGEPPGVADLDQQFCDRNGRQATELIEGAAARPHKRAELAA